MEDVNERWWYSDGGQSDLFYVLADECMALCDCELCEQLHRPYESKRCSVRFELSSGSYLATWSWVSHVRMLLGAQLSTS